MAMREHPFFERVVALDLREKYYLLDKRELKDLVASETSGWRRLSEISLSLSVPCGVNALSATSGPLLSLNLFVACVGAVLAMIFGLCAWRQRRKGAALLQEIEQRELYSLEPEALRLLPPKSSDSVGSRLDLRH